MDAFGQAQNTIRSALDNFLPRTIESAAGQKWYQQPTARIPGVAKDASMNPRVLGAQRGFLEENSYANAMYRKQAAAMAQSLSNPGTGQGQSVGGMGDPQGAEWAKVNQWNSLINSAVARVQQEMGIAVPGNVVKAVMKLESGGENIGCNAWGYCGLMQTGSGSWINNFDPNVNRTPEGNIYYGVQELANWYKAVGTGNWEDAAAAYFSGYNYNNPNVSDGYGTTVGQYRNIIRQNLAALNSAGGSMTGGSGQWGTGGGGRGVAALFGPSASHSNDFGVTSGNGLYGYGTSYGLNGVQHTGLDVMQPLGSPLYAPAGGVVVCVGCWRNDHLTGGVGRIEIEMPDGARVLYDHTNKSYVQVGQKLNGGELIGTSGGMYSPHTHMEVRVPDRSQSSGYRLVDPVQYFGGYVGGGTAGGNGSNVTLPREQPRGWDLLRQILGNR